MRKTGIFIGLGMAISLSIFIVAGVIYYNPVIRTSLFALEEAKVSEQEVPKIEAEKVVTVEIEKPEKLPLEVAVEKPAELAPEVAVEKPVELPPEVVVEKPVELPLEVAVEKPTVVVPEVKEPEPIVVEKAVEMPPIEEIEIVELEEEAIKITDLEVEERVEEVETVVKEPRIPPAPVMHLSVTEYVEPVKAERVEIFNRPLYRVEEKPFQLEHNLVALLPLKAKERVDYIWTETTVEEGEPLFIDPIKFNELAFERHRIAVDEVLEQLNW
jgi:hypothetical protein